MRPQESQAQLDITYVTNKVLVDRTHVAQPTQGSQQHLAYTSQPLG